MYVLALAQSIPSFYWIPIILFTCFLFINVINRFTAWYNYFQKPSLEIIYANGKYNKQRYIKILNKDLFTYTIGIHNIRKQTIKPVFVTVEDEHTLHYNTNKYSCDINPNAIELFVIYTVPNQDSVKNKEIIIKVTGDNIKSIEEKIIL
jgi:hypothetical protein